MQLVVDGFHVLSDPVDHEMAIFYFAWRRKATQEKQKNKEYTHNLCGFKNLYLWFENHQKKTPQKAEHKKKLKKTYKKKKTSITHVGLAMGPGAGLVTNGKLFFKTPPMGWVLDWP